MTNTNLHIGPAPDYVLKMGKEFLKHKGIIEIIKPRQSAKREIHTDHSLQMLIRTLKQRQNALAPDFVGPLHWDVSGDISTTFAVARSIVIVRYTLPARITMEDRFILHYVFTGIFHTST